MMRKDSFLVIFNFFLLSQGNLVLFQSNYDSFSSRTSFDWNCLYFHSTDDSVDVKYQLSRRFHRIPFCHRHDHIQHLINDMSITHGQAIPFNELYQQNISATQLLTWFAPIDVAERYEKYRHVGSNETFYNCSSPWFGSRCQYRFEGDDRPSSFDQIVRDTFQLRLKAPKNITRTPCYPFLLTCHGTTSSLCLDWREICDGRVDCLNGEDEEECEKLELHKCSFDDEFRCHSRGQCIPLDFRHDGYQNVDCLDGTDEMSPSYSIDAGLPNIPCVVNPLFTCEERTCRNRNSYSCNNDLCLEKNQPNFFSRKCDSNSLSRIQQALSELNNTCQAALLCFFGVNSPLWRPGDSIDQCLPLSSQCDTEWVSLHPGLLDGPFQYIYLTNRSISDFRVNIIPDYFCFDHNYCPALLTLVATTNLNNKLICVQQNHLPNQIRKTAATNLIGFEILFQNFVRFCSTMGIESVCSHSSLYHCNQSMKCISSHRLVDGIRDCFYGEDESFPACQLNDSNRFICASNLSICLASIVVADNRPDCQQGEDEYLLRTSYRKSMKSSVYATYCDGNPDEMESTNFSSDEMECDLWPCNTPYTRCSDGWQCPNGIDELNCAGSRCKENEHLTETHNDRKLICISIENLYDRYLNQCSTKDFSLWRQVYFEDEKDMIINNSIRWTKHGFITREKLCHKNSMLDHGDEQSGFVPRDNEMRILSVSNTKLGRLRFLRDNLIKRNHRFYLASQLPSFPPPTDHQLIISSENKSNFSLPMYKIDPLLTYYCHRGILLRHGNQQLKTCLCPPSSFGQQCQHQNQRVSLTLQFIYRGLTKTSLFYIIAMLIDQHGHIAPQVEHWTFVPFISCGVKHNFYLLYPQRPKNISNHYFVHIDVYDRLTLSYHTSWHLSIDYSFLPVHRLVARLIIPDRLQISSCSLSCGDHGQCQRYNNKPDQVFCQCQPGYRGLTCNETVPCSCVSSALCHISSICLCPINRFGRECYLEHHICQSNSNPCQYGGTCIPDDPRSNLQGFTCLCSTGYMGVTCEKMSNQIDLNFEDHILESITMVTVHAITVFDEKQNERMTIFKKVPIDSYRISLLLTDPFHIVFVEISPRNLYLALVQAVYVPSQSVSLRIQSNQRCMSIDEIRNDTVWLTSPLWSRAKSYPRLCRQHRQLTCFHDGTLICLCDQHRFAQCFEFNQSMTYDCDKWNMCENDGRCLLNNFTCPTTFSCICPRCFYGARCQLSTRGYVLALEPIIGYHIKPHRPLYQQSPFVKLTLLINGALSLLSLISGSLSIMTFAQETLRKYSCSVYLLASSILSLCIVLVLNVKVWLLLLSQMMLVENEIALRVFCVLTDASLRSLVACWDWLNACVSIERVMTVIQGVRFNREKHLHAAKGISVLIIFSCFLSHLHDSSHRRLVDDFDAEEKRRWCFVDYSALMERIDLIAMFLHFLLPFLINLVSAIIILIFVTRSRFHVQTKVSFLRHFRSQIAQHKHLLVTPVLLAVLGLPRLVIPFLTRCMKTRRNPTVFLIAYFTNYIPMALSVFIFVLPSQTYRAELTKFIQAIKHRYL